MQIRLFSFILSNIFIILLIIYSIFYRKEFDIIEKNLKINNNFLISMISPFFYFVFRNKNIIYKLINSKVKISIKNLNGEENFLYYQNYFLALKLMILYYLNILILISYFLLNHTIILIGGYIILFLTNFLYDDIQIKKYNKKKEEIKQDLNNIISRLFLMLKVGINLRSSLSLLLQKNDGEMIKKLKEANTLINNGYSELEAYNHLLSQTDDLLIRKFISIIMQNLQKGGNDIQNQLNLLKKESDEFKKNYIILKSQEANRKLLIPNIIIFTGIMLMVMLPILINTF